MRVVPGGKINPKYKLFIDHYLNVGSETYLHATKSAIAAGYSEKTARAQGSRLLTNVDIMLLVNEHYKNSHLKTEEALKLLGEQSRSEYHRYINDDGEIDLKGLKKAGLGHLIRGVKKTPQGNQVEFYDGQKALAMVAKHLGLLDDNLTVKIESELDKLLDILEEELEPDQYERITNRLGQRYSQTETEEES